MTSKKRQEIVARVRRELLTATGVDFDKYRTPEMFTKVSELMIFPLYALPTIFGAALTSIVVFGIAYTAYLIHSPAWLLAFSCLLLGVPVFIGFGVCIGCLILIRRIASDLKLIVASATGMIKTAAIDVQSSFTNIAEKGGNALQQIPTPSQLAKGILIVSLLPVLEQVIRKRIKVIGGYLSGMVGTLMMNIAESVFKIAGEKVETSNALSFADNKLQNVTDLAASSLCAISENDRLKKLLFSVTSFADKFENIADTAVESSCKKAAKPFKLLSFLFGAACLVAVAAMNR